MNNLRKFLFLGTGGSMGIPVIGCHCAICKSPISYNKRYRSSGLLTIGDKKILLDCGPDFHQQALQFHLDHLDGMILTHAHQDHVGGIDELRAYYLNSREALPCLLSKETADDILQRFSYIFYRKKVPDMLTSHISLEFLNGKRGVTSFLGIPVQYMTYEQGGMAVNGFRIDDFAYLSDIRHYPETIFEDLKGVKKLVISALRFEPSHLHFSIDEAINFSQKVESLETWFTHISHDLGHEETNRHLPSNIWLAYDGLEINF